MVKCENDHGNYDRFKCDEMFDYVDKIVHSNGRDFSRKCKRCGQVQYMWDMDKHIKIETPIHCACRGHYCQRDRCQQKAREERARMAREAEARRAQEEQEKKIREVQEMANTKIQNEALKNEIQLLKETQAREMQERREREEQAAIAREQHQEREQIAAEKIQFLLDQNESLKVEKHNLEQILEQMKNAEPPSCLACHKKEQKINLLEKENQELRSELQVAEELVNKWKEAQWATKKTLFLEKSQQEDWNISQSSQEDMEFLFEELGILPFLSKFNDLGYSDFDDFTLLDAQTVVELVEVNLKEATQLILNVEMMAKGIFTKEQKEKHLESCPICKMGMEKGLKEYGIPDKMRESIKDKLAGWSLGELIHMTSKDFIHLGIDKTVLLSLVKAVRSMKENHKF